MSSTADVREVSFRYGRTVALTNLSIEIPAGRVGLLGPNGAGKSTLMALLSTLTLPQAGDVHVLGRSTQDRAARKMIRSRTGLLPQRFALVPSMTVSETVAYVAWVHGVPDRQCRQAAADVLESLALSELAARKVRTLSGGQRQRLGVACVLVHNPSFVILDEPTVGIDPTARIQLRRLLHDLCADRTMLLSTHLVEDVAHLCEHVIVLNHGTVVYSGAVDALVRIADNEVAGTLSSPLESAYERLLSSGGEI